jgi:hypothetical protein
MSIFTSDDLLLYLYKETKPEQSKAIEAALENDLALREELAFLKEIFPVQARLIKPSDGVVNRILAYAAGAPLEKQVQERQPSA